MRDAFPEFYRPTADDVRRFIIDGTVVVDANVLLALYELSAVQRDETLKVLETIGDRLWIPYQVGLEYQRNRLNVIQRQASHYTKLVNLHGVRNLDKLTEALSSVQVPPEVLDEVRPLLKDLAQRLDNATKNFINAAEVVRNRHVVTAEQGLNDDPVRKRLDVLFAGRVGERPSDKIKKERIAEAAKRRNAQVPPGYKDDNKATDEGKAGDYLVWSELLEHAKTVLSNGKPFLLVTNDTKEDWYDKSNGQQLGPRPELVREFRAHNTNGYHQVTLEGFLRLAKDHLKVDVDETTIEKASELSRPTHSFQALLTPGGEPKSVSRRVFLSSHSIINALIKQLLQDVPSSFWTSEMVAQLIDALHEQARTQAAHLSSADFSRDELEHLASLQLQDIIEFIYPDWSDAPIPDPYAVQLFIDLIRFYRRANTTSRQHREPEDG